MFEGSYYVNYYVGGFVDSYQKITLREAIISDKLFKDKKNNYYFRLHTNDISLERVYRFKTKKVIENRYSFISFEKE